jgi:hypothetical protein
VAAPPVDFLNSFFWQFTTIIVAIVAVIGFLVYRYYLEPPISRAFMSARWSKGPVGFVQDDANVVHLVTSQAALPEGIIYTKRGFFLQGRMPYIRSNRVVSERGLPDRDTLMAEIHLANPELSIEDVEAEANKRLVALAAEAGKRKPGRPKQSEVEDLSLEYRDALGTALQTPTLAGFGRSVFFGYDGAPLVSNPKALALAHNNLLQVVDSKIVNGKVVRSVEKFVAHADMRVMKEIIPATISRTQLGNLYKWAVAKGYEKSGKDQMKLIYIAIAAAIPIACLGIVAFLLINGGGA